MSVSSLRLFGLAALLLFWVSSCKKDDPQDPTPVEPVTPSNTTLLIGRVTDPAGNPVSGAQLTVGAKSGISNPDGTFALADVASGGRIFVSASKTGYFKGSQGLIPENNGVS